MGMRLHWNVNISFSSNFNRLVVTGIHVTNYAHTWIVS